jgi:hypothetical protein
MHNQSSLSSELYSLPNKGFAYPYKLNIENMLNYLIEKNPGSKKLKTDKIKNAL